MQPYKLKKTLAIERGKKNNYQQRYIVLDLKDY